ncbi:hypothetical protein [Nocardia sp. NPDC059239]|uniref:hypothetical protein n=1 Tax=unclassified Nocardia TaxID=2637762 RepID=UPI0036CF3B5F
MGDNTIRALLEDVWDDGNASGLDGWVGPGRGTEPVDEQAISNRRRVVDKALRELETEQERARDLAAEAYLACVADVAAHHAFATLLAAFGVTASEEVAGVLEGFDQVIAVALAAMRADPATMEAARKRLRALGVTE